MVGILKNHVDDELEDDFDDLDDRKSLSDTSATEEESRDEVAEIRKQSRAETSKVHTWRIAVTLALLVTAISVTFTTYWLLVQQEDENFRNVYAQFARTVADAAVDQQKDLRSALRSLSDTISLSANLVSNGNPTWPYFFPPMFETYAEDYMEISRAEFVGISNVVSREQRDSYINYSTSVYQQAVADAHIIRHGSLDLLNNDTNKYNPYITKKTPDGFVEDDERDFYFVRTIQSPPPRKYGPQINWNLASSPQIRVGYDSIIALQNETTISKIRPFLGLPADEHKGFHSDDNADNPHCFAYHPVHKYVGDSTSDIVAILASAIAFDASMRDLLPDNVKGMLCVVSNNCNQTFSYLIDGQDAFFQGMTDLHNDKYDGMALDVDLALHTHPDLPSTPGHCMYKMRIYPTQAFEDDYKTNTPAIFAAVVAGTFILVAVAYFLYDINVQRRNESMITNAAKSAAIVSSVVPDHLRARLLGAQEESIQRQQFARSRHGSLKTFLNDDSKKEGHIATPLADLFLETTIMFADITGFTAWSSVREPQQVFVLLETLFASFDKVAKQRKIFKVETVGDCYVAVCGLPEPRFDHAAAMARYARKILEKMRVLTKELETTLGPDTGDLSLRIGIHSGPVTAGVLRGDRARFQLFGDTMNTAARLESSSQPNRIQCSKETAELLIKAGKGNWVQKRSDLIDLKGKGSIQAYWVNVSGERAGSIASGISSEFELAGQMYGKPFPGLDDRTRRLIGWNVEMLLRILKQIGARRTYTTVRKRLKNSDKQPTLQVGEMPLDEVREIIHLPEFNVRNSVVEVDPDHVDVPEEVVQELHHLVSSIACMYNNNPFHNFDHASHVVMSVIKLLSRIVAPTQLEGLEDEDNETSAAKLHDNTFGITSDPLTQFACAFSALIHDVDHVGVSNAQLVKEGVPIAKKYKERSVAEQNSLDLSWDLLNQDRYEALRAYLFPSQTELCRFRQLVVNAVMSTDIVDKELKALRNGRWDKAFKKGDCVDQVVDENIRDDVNRKATIVIEHIIQASDISHTMQHWHVYRKWNEHLFEELYVAYLNGRMEKDPATFWYKGEFGFFDFYIIPLTRKLKECGVFGVSSDEYLQYALKNREQWEAQGEQVVAGMIEKCRKTYGVKGPDGSIMQVQESALPPPPFSSLFPSSSSSQQSPQENDWTMPIVEC